MSIGELLEHGFNNHPILFFLLVMFIIPMLVPGGPGDY